MSGAYGLRRARPSAITEEPSSYGGVPELLLIPTWPFRGLRTHIPSWSGIPTLTHHSGRIVQPHGQVVHRLISVVGVDQVALLRDSGNLAYDELGATLDVVIAEALGVTFPASSSEDYAVIKRADIRALMIEARDCCMTGAPGSRRKGMWRKPRFATWRCWTNRCCQTRPAGGFIAAHERLTRPSEETRSTRQRR